MPEYDNIVQTVTQIDKVTRELPNRERTLDRLAKEIKAFTQTSTFKRYQRYR